MFSFVIILSLTVIAIAGGEYRGREIGQVDVFSYVSTAVPTQIPSVAPSLSLSPSRTPTSHAPTKQPTRSPSSTSYPTTVASLVQLGTTLVGVADYDVFGFTVALSEDATVLAVGASAYDAVSYLGTDHGAVFVYKWNGTAWNQRGSEITGVSSSQYFGKSVSLSSDGSILAVGTPDDDSWDVDAGAVYVYEWDNSAESWQQQLGSPLFGSAAYDQFGFSVSLSGSGTLLIVGAPRVDTASTTIVSNVVHGKSSRANVAASTFGMNYDAGGASMYKYQSN